MNIKSPLLRWSVAVLAVLMLTACGSTTSSPVTSSPASGDSTTSLPATGESTVQKAQTGTVTFTVQFPQAALKKAMMDERTVSIDVQWYSYYTSGSTLLTPNPVTGVATATLDVPTGYVEFQAIAKDSNNYQIDSTSTAGEITAGSNTVYLTFLGGDWQFVDANDNPLPQTFDTTTLTGFSMESNLTYGVTKAAIDTTKPYSWSDYQLQWQTTTAPIGPVMEAWHVAQFNTTASQFGSDWLNITDPSRSDSIYDSVPYQPGDRMIWIHDWEADDVNLPDLRDASGNDLGPAFSTAGNTEVFDGNHIVGNLMAMTFTSFNAVAGSTVANCDEFYYPQATTAQAARVAALKAGLAAKAGKAAIGDDTTIALGTITATYQECDYSNNTIYTVTEVFSDAVKREFRAKGSQAGSIFTPPVQASAVGTWMKNDPVSGETAIISFLDGSNYLMGEDGIADPPYGGPGIERGTYSIEPITNNTTFSVTYETNGDWGPAEIGFPNTYSLVGLTADTLTIMDPADSSTIAFDRVPTDPTNPVIGSWYFSGTGMGETILVLLDNGQYYAVQADGVDSGNRFFESGTYTYNTTDGTFTGTGVFSSNPANSAIAAPGEINSSYVSISDNTLTISNIDGTFTATRM